MGIINQPSDIRYFSWKYGLPKGDAFTANFATTNIELLTGGLGLPIVIAYGRHIVGGNVIYQNVSEVDGETVAFVALGEGEWEEAENVWVSGEEIDIEDTDIFHFHPGLDGELGVEVSPGTPNQKYCSLFPSSYTQPRCNFSRTAYIGLVLEGDPDVPDVQLEIVGIYKTKKVRIFNASGTETSYEYSVNHAWCILDMLINRWLMPHAKVDNSLSSTLKGYIDFQAFYDAADYYDDDVDGDTRFECHVAFSQQATLQDALDHMLRGCNSYLIEKGGKIALYPDKPRAVAFTAGRNQIAEGGLEFSKKDTLELSNQYIIKYRDLDSGDGEEKDDFQAQSVEYGTDTYEDYSVDQPLRDAKAEIDIGNAYESMARRVGEYIKERSIDQVDQRALVLLPTGEDELDLLSGDLISVPADVDSWDDTTHEILEISDEPDGTRQVFTQESPMES